MSPAALLISISNQLTLSASRPSRNGTSASQRNRCVTHSRPRLTRTLWVGSSTPVMYSPISACDAGLQVNTKLPPMAWIASCLLYTSDAADEEDSVDLGG